jgi:hypothetical protein
MPTPARIDRECKIVVPMQGSTIDTQWRYDRDIVACELNGKRMLLFDRRGWPTAWAVDFHNDRITPLNPELVDPIFVAIERK